MKTPEPWPSPVRWSLVLLVVVALVASVAESVTDGRDAASSEERHEALKAGNRLALDLFEAVAGEHDTYVVTDGNDGPVGALREHQDARQEFPAHPDPADLAAHLTLHHADLAKAYTAWHDTHVSYDDADLPPRVAPSDPYGSYRWDLVVPAFVNDLPADSAQRQEVATALAKAGRFHAFAVQETEKAEKEEDDQ